MMAAEEPDLESLLAIIVEGELSAGESARLGQLLRDDAQARALYRDYLHLHVMLEWDSAAPSTADDVRTEPAQHAAPANRQAFRHPRVPFWPAMAAAAVLVVAMLAVLFSRRESSLRVPQGRWQSRE